MTARDHRHDVSRDAVQYSVLPSRGYPHRIKSFWRLLLYRHAYEDAHMEKLYRIFTFKLQLARLRRILAFLVLYSTLMCVLNFVFVSDVNLENICYVVLVILFVLVLLFLHTKYAATNRISFIAILVLFLCLCLTVMSLPVNFPYRPFKHYSPADGVWQGLLMVFIVYTMLPLPVYIATSCGFLVATMHTLTAYFLAETHEWLLWRHITANLLLFASVNIIGVYIQDKTEHAMRKVFHEACNCITARIDVEEENDKLEKLLCSILPQGIAHDLKKDLLSVETPSAGQVQPFTVCHDDVSILYANIIGVTELAAQCTALELVHILNEIVAKFDKLVQEKHCERMRVLGDVYSCMSGHTDTRPDHAKCCVDLAIDLSDFLREVREGADLELYTKIGIHTGQVTSGIVGSIRWSYDVFSRDVHTAKEVMQVCSPGKVLISQSTFEYLQGEYDVEPANVYNATTFLQERQMETFYVVPSPNRSPVGLFRPQGDMQLSTHERLSYRNMSRAITSLVNGLQPRAEMPFSHVVNSPNRYPGDVNSLDSKHASVTLQREKLQRYLSHAVMSRALDKSIADWVNLFSLRFHHAYKEKRFQKQEDISFPTAILCSMVQLVLITALQAVVLPRTLLLLVIFLAGFTWIATVLIIFLGTKLRCVDWDFQKSVVVRLILMVVTVMFIHLVGQINVLCCSGGRFIHFSTNNSAVLTFNDDHHVSCDMPHYIYLSGVTSLVTLAIFFKMAAWLKIILLLPMAVGYVVVIEYTHAQLFTGMDKRLNPDYPSRVEGAVALLLVAVVIYLQSRQSEWTHRLSFLWRDQAMEERIAVSEFQNQTRQVVMNMFPSHIALHFVDFTGFKHSLSMFGHSYQKVGLCCVSLPNFWRHFPRSGSLNTNNNSPSHHVADGFMTLNDVIKSFDQLLQDDRFSDVDKIRSCGTSYVIAIGLAPERPMKDTNESVGQFLTVLVEFVQAMKEKLKAYNEDRRTHFQLRAGLSVGPLTIGVIGARKPVLDIWGYTVYLANLMEASGKADCIQVTSELVQPLATRYEFQRNSPIFLNGRGETCTHFLTGRKILHIPDNSLYSGKVPIHKRSDHYKQSPFGTPIGRFKQLPSDSSINTSGYITQPQTAERPTSTSGQHRRHAEHSRELCFKPKESPNLSYGIRIQGLQRSRLGSDESPNIPPKNTMTPPSSLNRRRNSGSFTGSDKVPSQNLLQPPVNEGHQMRMASPDLPLVHFQRNGTQTQVGEAGERVDIVAKPSFSGHTLTQSQILNQGSDKRRSTPQMGYASPFSPVVNGNLAGNRHSVVSSRRSTTRTPSSNRSSAETVRSVISMHAIDHQLLHNSPVPALQSQSSTPNTRRHNEATDAQMALRESLLDATGSEIAEMDHILRELGCTSSNNTLNSATCPITTDQNITAAANNFDLPCAVRNEPVHSVTEPSSQQISEYENDDSAETTVSSDSKAKPPPAPGRDMGYIEKPSYVTHLQGKKHPYSKLNMKHKYHLGSHATYASSSSQESTRLVSAGQTDAQNERLLRNLAQNRIILPPDDSSSTSSDVYGIPKSRSVQNQAQHDVNHLADDGDGDSPPPLPPPPSMEALYGRRYCQHVQRQYSYPQRQHYNTPHDQASAFRPVTVLDPSSGYHQVTRQGKARPIGPVRPIPAVRRVAARSGMSTMSSNTSDEAPVPMSRRKPRSDHHRHNNDKTNRGSREVDQITVPNAEKSGKKSPKSKTPETKKNAGTDTKKSPVEQDTLGSNKTPHESDDNTLTDSTLHNDDPSASNGRPTSGSGKKRPPAPPFQVKRRQQHSQPVRRCRSLDYIPSDVDDGGSISSRAHSPSYGSKEGPITHLIKTHVIGDNISISSLESGSEMSRSDPALNYDSSSTNAYESEYDNYRPGMASDEDYFVPEPVSDVDLELFDDINLEEVTVSDKYDIDVHDFINMNSMTKKQITEV